MKKIFLFTLIVMRLTLPTPRNTNFQGTGRLEIKEVNHVTIEGTTGNEIIFSTTNHNEKDERAQGLRAVSGYGLEDNSGIGLSVVDEGAII